MSRSRMLDLTCCLLTVVLALILASWMAQNGEALEPPLLGASLPETPSLIASIQQPLFAAAETNRGDRQLRATIS